MNQRTQRVILITTKLLQQFGHELASKDWIVGSEDYSIKCREPLCQCHFVLFNYENSWKLMEPVTCEGFHFRDDMEYRDIKLRALNIHTDMRLYCIKQ